MAKRVERTVLAIPWSGPGKRELRARIEERAGAQCVDLRVWYRQFRSFRPSTHGIRLDSRDLPALRDALIALSEATASLSSPTLVA